RTRAGRPPRPWPGWPRRCPHPSTRGSTPTAPHDLKPRRSALWATWRYAAVEPSGRHAARTVGCPAMELRPVGSSGLVVSRLGLGTATWGRDTDPDDAAAQLVAFREAGGTLLDIGPW